MTDINIPAERRRRQAQERLGATKIACPLCGETNPHCFEKHHLAQKKFDKDFTIGLCMNCHRKLSDPQKDHPKPLRSNPNWLEQGGHLLLGLADFLVFLVEKLKDLGLKMIEAARAELACATTDKGA